MKRKSFSNFIPLVIIAVILVIGIGSYLFAQGTFSPTPTPPPTSTQPVLQIPQLNLTPPPSLSELSRQVAADYPELAKILDNPELGSVYKDFYITYQNAGQEAALALARQRGILNENGDVVMTLILDSSEQTAELVSELEAEGVIVESSYQDRINIVIPTGLILEQIDAAEPNLVVDRISNLEHVISLQLPNKLAPDQGAFPGEGVAVTMAKDWQQQGITGQGVKVGVLDLGFAGYEKLLGTELPKDVVVSTFGSTAQFGVQIHGTACAEIVHEMAPDAQLYLAYFDGTEVALGQAVDWLLGQGVKIISNSTSISGLSPMDGSGFAADIANRVHDAGVFWVNAAGNRADEHYRAVFKDTNGDTLHEFAPDVTGLPFTMKGGTASYLILSWNDWPAHDQDYDLILFDKSGNFLAKAEDFQTGQPGQRAAEVISYQFAKTDTYLLAIQNREGKARGDATLDLFVYNGQLPPEFMAPEASLGTPADARGAFTVGAVKWSNDVLEPYSSQGPTNDGRIKPDLVAPSAVQSASYKPFFDGTSAATPHVAGAAALTLQVFPNFSPDEIANLFKSRAIKLDDTLPNNSFGAGRLNLGPSPDVAQ
ncbi:MAG: S8 family serine peptidase [Anaerolineae bacterium]|nr:S8 family serine peptidase [Anaerolineae bacterium]